jgi:hypothetical protein
MYQYVGLGVWVVDWVVRDFGRGECEETGGGMLGCCWLSRCTHVCETVAGAPAVSAAGGADCVH